MYKTLLRYATPFTTGLFVVSLISGIALFFHVGQAYFHSMHEWLSMVLIAPFILHIARNWRPFLSYFKHVPMLAALAISLIASGYYVWEGSQATARGGNPAIALARKVQASPLTAVAPIYGHTGESLQSALIDKGYTITSVEATLDDIAKASGKNTMAVLVDLSTIGN